MAEDVDSRDGQISELTRLLEQLLGKYVDASRQDRFYDIAHDTLAEKVQRVLNGESSGLTAEFRLMRKVCKKAVRFSRAIVQDDGDDHLEELLEAADAWENHMNKQGYTLK